jgi:LacI family transcriptional regulator
MTDSSTPNRKISQQRLAKDLGLSQALVSMVLNGRRKGISEDSYQRIWAYASQLGYQPKRLRVAINGNTTKQTNVGFVLRSAWTLKTQNVYLSGIQQGLHEALREQGISTLFLGTEDKQGESVLSTPMETRRTLLGLVILGQVAAPFFRAMKQMCPRLVVISTSYPGQCHSVQPNERQSLNLLIDHLVAQGHRRIAWFGGSRNLKRHEERFQAFVDAVEVHGLVYEPEWAFMFDEGNRQEGRQAAEAFLGKEGLRPTAVVCYNGLMARGAINFLQMRGLSIPLDLSVVAVDSTLVCTEDQPFITGASSDPEAMGRKAAELLLGATTTPDEVYCDAIIPAKLSVRESSAAPRSAS